MNVLAAVAVASLALAVVLLTGTGGRGGPAHGVHRVPHGVPLAGRRQWLAQRLGRRSRAARRRAAAVGVLDAVAAELRAGRPPAPALLAAAEPYAALLTQTVGAARYGGPLAAALEADSHAAGADALRRLAACWRVAEHTGAGLAAAVERLAVTEREAERIRLELAARAAEPRATMRVLAALPAFGVALGTMVGADPWGWLIGTSAGRVVLVAGVGLDLVGVLWARRLVASVEDLL